MNPFAHRASAAATSCGLLALTISLLASGCISHAGDTQPAPTTTATTATTTATTNSPPAHTTASISIGVAPDDVMAAFDSIWVADHHGAAIFRLNPGSGKVIAKINAGTQPGFLTAGAGAVWETNYDGTITRVDPKTNHASSVGRFPSLCGQPTMAAGAVCVYICDVPRPYVARVDVRTGRTTAKIPASAYMSSLLMADGVLWMTTSTPGELLRLDPHSGAVLQRITVPGCPWLTRTAYGYHSLWISQFAQCPTGTINSVLRVDPHTGHILAKINTDGLTDVTLGDGSVWVSDTAGTIGRLNPTTMRLSPWTSLNSSNVFAIEISNHALWAISFDEAKLWRIATR